MKEFSFSEARQSFAAVLDRARREGAVRIRRRDGQVFMLTPVAERRSPLDVVGVKLDLTRDELVELVHAGRRQS